MNFSVPAPSLTVSLAVASPESDPPLSPTAIAPGWEMWAGVTVAGLALIGCGWGWWRAQQRLSHLQQVCADQEAELIHTTRILQTYTESPELANGKRIAWDYLRMRMDEEVFHYQVLGHIQEKLAEVVAQVVKSTVPDPHATKSILVDRPLDIEYDLEGLDSQWQKCTVLRLHVQLGPLPVQSSSNTIKQLVEAVTEFINHPQGQTECKIPFQEQWLALQWETGPSPIPTIHLQNYAAKSRPGGSYQEGERLSVASLRSRPSKPGLSASLASF